LVRPKAPLTTPVTSTHPPAWAWARPSALRVIAPLKTPVPAVWFPPKPPLAPAMVTSRATVKAPSVSSLAPPPTETAVAALPRAPAAPEGASAPTSRVHSVRVVAPL